MWRRSSPHTRGAHPVAVAVGVGPRIIPAYAGSTAETIQNPSNHRDHPRIRGEHFQVSFQFPLGAGSSPHTRGAHLDGLPCHAASRIIPAYAGSTWGEDEECFQGEDHPRIRGEHFQGCGECVHGVGSSPHTRGAPRRRSAHGRTGRDHPRIRGEHYAAHKVAIEAGGSSPHTRGAPTAPVVRVAELGIIPAYAGSTGTRRRTDRSGRDHPRIRGEHARRRAAQPQG